MVRVLRNLYRAILRGVVVPSIVAGLLVALVVAGGAVAFASSRPAGFEAEARLVVLPRPGLDPPTATAYYETLSRGQIVGTVAEVLQLERFAAAAADRLGVPPSERTDVEVDAAVLPESAMISLTVQAGDPALAESLADGIVDESEGYIADLSDGYALELVSSAAGTALPTGLSGPQYAAVMALAALVIGVGVQQVVQQVLLALDRRAEVEALGRRPDLEVDLDGSPPVRSRAAR